MPAHRRAGGDRALEIYPAALAQLFQICPVERFFKEVERELLVADSCSGETTAVHRHAVADGNLGGELGRGQLQFSACAARVERDDAADFLDETGEHALLLALAVLKIDILFALGQRPT